MEDAAGRVVGVRGEENDAAGSGDVFERAADAVDGAVRGGFGEMGGGEDDDVLAAGDGGEGAEKLGDGNAGGNVVGDRIEDETVGV